MSRPRPFDLAPRLAGREVARPAPLRPVDRDAARAAWAWAMKCAFGTRERTAAEMDVTFQTSCNWWDSTATPTGDKVMQFSRDYPEIYALLLARVAGC